ncbi:hypothetical protein IFR04_014202 [Cadophora malorum]|uniref:Uncharacterized protein n=1 Tax=Cadophora malorum TaxID=108018 RepID=A0A8H7VZQ3_9HELO|nr:hypothetical protein IFR04_014202 [Cadophora malorum]
MSDSTSTNTSDATRISISSATTHNLLAASPAFCCSRPLLVDNPSLTEHLWACTIDHFLATARSIIAWCDEEMLSWCGTVTKFISFKRCDPHSDYYCDSVDADAGADQVPDASISDKVSDVADDSTGASSARSENQPPSPNTTLHLSETETSPNSNTSAASNSTSPSDRDPDITYYTQGFLINQNAIAWLRIDFLSSPDGTQKKLHQERRGCDSCLSRAQVAVYGEGLGG